ncbi:MAG: chromate efflux transporter [Candidatus Gottesmanbacteria bacterium]|nr:chromate efflux transporter [Candidatus Gottesmanbacteria bacterium]
MTNKQPKLSEFAKVVSYIGIIGYGGPAIIAQMKKALVHKHQWVAEEDFMNTLSLAQILPGATGVALLGYLGYRMKGILGWIVGSFLYVFPAFLFTTVLSVLYFQYHSLSLVQKLFAGLGALVVGLLINAILQLSKPVFGKADRKDYKGFLIALTGFSLAVFTHINVVFIILLSGFLGFLFYFFTHEFEGFHLQHTNALPAATKGTIVSRDVLYLLIALAAGAVLLFLSHSIYWLLSATFFQIGSIAFGGGFTTIPLIQHIVVDGLHWVSLLEFRDGIAIGQITPGPVFITAAFIGYKVAGWLGALVSTVSVFLPSLLLILILGKFHEQIKHLKIVRVIIKGFLAGFIGIIASVALSFGEKSLINWQTWLIFLATLLVVVKLKKDVIWAILGTILVSLIIL